MKRFTRIFVTGVLFVISIVSIGCKMQPISSEDIKISDIRSDLTYAYISNQAFMGGSTLYNPENELGSQIVDGACIAVRLGYVDTGIDGQSYVDKSELAEYGYIKITKICRDYVCFDYVHLSKTNECYDVKSFSINNGEAVDINADGSNDLSFSAPKRKRPGLENCRNLTFISSQESLYTTMFAVLPEQYPEQTYPSGLMGINPDGYFIISKYKRNTTSRSVVTGVNYGDFVFDEIEGTYSKVISLGSVTNRSITDDEIKEVVESPLFTEADFYLEENLYEFIRLLEEQGIISDTSNNGIEVLNSLITNRYLLSLLINNGIDILNETDLNTALSDLSTLNDDEIPYINRYILAAAYPEYCSNPCSTLAIEIFPLLYCNIGNKDYNYIDPESEEQNSRAVTTDLYTTEYLKYVSQKNSIESEFSKYFKIPWINKNTEHFSVSSGEGELKKRFEAGIYGKIENIWGKKIEIEVSGVIFVQVETRFSKNFPMVTNKSLLAKPISVNLGTIPIKLGIVNVDLRFPMTFDLKLNVSGNVNYPTPLFLGYTGLNGCGLCVGMNYSSSFEKKWGWLPVPKLNASSYGGVKEIKQNAVYGGYTTDMKNTISVIDTVLPESASITVSLIPEIKFGIDVDAFWCIGVGIDGTMGIENYITVSSKKDPLTLIKNNQLPITGTAGVNMKFQAGLKGHIGVKFNLMDLSYEKRFTLGDPKMVPIVSKKMF